MENILFEEKQKSSKVVVNICAAVMLIFILFLGINFFLIKSHVINVLVLPFAIVSIVFFILSMMLSLEVKLKQEGIYYRCRPFHISERFIPYSDIEVLKLGKLKTLFSYYGFRIKLGIKGGLYLFGGYDAIQIKKRNSKVLVLGTQRLHELDNVVESINDTDLIIIK